MHDISPEKDAWEEWADELYAEGNKELAVRLRLTYEDGEGRITHRTVTTERYARTSENGGVLSAFCHLRNARRPFRFSRIRHVADLDTSIRIDNLGEWLDSRYAPTSLGRRDAFMEWHAPALGVLFYVAKADDAFRAKERELMQRFCEAHGCAVDVASLVVETVAQWANPSTVQYGRDLKEVLAHDETYRREVLQVVKAMIASDKTVRENETRALARLVRELKLTS